MVMKKSEITLFRINRLEVKDYKRRKMSSYHYKEVNSQEDIIIVNIYVLNIGAPK
jgi:hypothetical protein